MLFFLSIAAKRQFLIDEYVDHVGVMQPNAEGDGDDNSYTTTNKLFLRVRYSLMKRHTAM